MKVLIAGAGIGGLAAGLALHQAGHDVVLFEQAPELGEVGAGLQLSPNAVRVLHAWGLMPELNEIAFRPEAIELRLHKSARRIAHIPLGAEAEARYGFPYLHVHRGDLHRRLAETLRARAGEVIRTGARVADVVQEADHASLIFGNGSVETGDLVIGADGIHSVVREALFGKARPLFKKMTAWRGLVPAHRVREAGVRPSATSWMGPHAHAVTYYVRRGELLNFVGVTECENWTSESWTEQGSREELAADFADWHPSIRAVVEAIDAPFRWALHARAPLERWSEGRVTLLGDACHPMLPFLAQGAASAIEDAAVLTAALGQDDAPAALPLYEEIRKPRTSRIQKEAEANGRLFHLANPLLRAGVYRAMAAGGKVAPGLVASRYDWLMGYDPLSAV